jgi:EAL and modified HD-GYP domain-containing signal transduction protein
MALSPHAAAPEAAAPVVVRRPVLDGRLRTVGFELLLPEGRLAPDGWTGALPALMTGHPAYVGVTHEFLRETRPLPLEPGGVLLEVAGDGPVDDALLGVLRGLRAQGFGIVLDDFAYRPELEPLLEVADTVKLDVVALGEQRALAEMERLDGRGLALLADGVQDEDAFVVLRDAGFDLFQGRFYEHPNLVPGVPLGVTSAAAVVALADLQSAGTDFERLEQVIRREAGLSYRLLRYAKSAYVGLPPTIGSVRDALMALGSRSVRQWAIALVLGGLEHRPHALMATALVRARTCELILAPYDPDLADHAFTAGLFSLLDALLGAPMEDVLAGLPLAEDVEAAILRREGIVGKALEKAIAYERGDFGNPALAGHARTALAIAYADAVAWADAIL